MHSSLRLRTFLAACLLAMLPAAALALSDDASNSPQKPAASAQEAPPPPDQTTEGTVTVEGAPIGYQAIAGTILVGSTDKQDAAFGTAGNPEPKADDKKAEASARIFYVAYFKKDAKTASRPVTFFYNGGPGSSTVWLHMGAFGPRRVVTADDQHTPPAPYELVNNSYSLLDATDMVFIDAPGTGFGRLYGKDPGKAFWGVDQDANAFARFITRFLSQYHRWNSPKYLFGESYGTTRSAVVASLLETKDNVDLNGVILLSQILNFDDSPDSPQYNPGVDLPYVLALPTFAATAWYHHKLPTQPADLNAFLTEVEHYALGDYAHALAQGNELSDAERDAVAQKLHQYTGLSVDYLKKANLRVNVGEFNITLQGKEDLTTGRLDTRFSGPTIDPLAQEAAYDPQSAAISSAYTAAFNDYVRTGLKYGQGLTYLTDSGEINAKWDMKHNGQQITTNVMPDLAYAMKYDPRLKVMLNGGYFDLATPFFAAQFEMNHLPISPALRGNIQESFYQSGHMVYAHEPALKKLHDNVAAFIRGTHKPE